MTRTRIVRAGFLTLTAGVAAAWMGLPSAAQVDVDVSPGGVRVDVGEGERDTPILDRLRGERRGATAGQQPIDCAMACLDCSKHCAEMAQKDDAQGSHQACLMACLDCAKACVNYGVSSMKGAADQATKTACLEACRECAELCKQHEDPACQECARMCEALVDQLTPQI